MSSGSTSDAPPGPTADAAVTIYSCAKSVDAYCQGPGRCVRSWSDLPKCGAFTATRTCGPLRAFVTRGIDTGSTSYYDDSGQLVAIVDYGIGQGGCVAGPMAFTVPACSDQVANPPCPDAGP
jgi:hypothetical protein